MSHSGIMFARVLPSDAGTYRVWASSGRTGYARASCILKGVCSQSHAHMYSMTRLYVQSLLLLAVISSGGVCANSSTPGEYSVLS